MRRRSKFWKQRRRYCQWKNSWRSLLYFTPSSKWNKQTKREERNASTSQFVLKLRCLETAMIIFVEELLNQSLSMPANRDLHIKRAPCIRCVSIWRSTSMVHHGQVYERLNKGRNSLENMAVKWIYLERINLDHDYAPNILIKWQEYVEDLKI